MADPINSCFIERRIGHGLDFWEAFSSMLCQKKKKTWPQYNTGRAVEKRHLLSYLGRCRRFTGRAVKLNLKKKMSSCYHQEEAKCLEGPSWIRKETFCRVRSPCVLLSRVGLVGSGRCQGKKPTATFQIFYNTVFDRPFWEGDQVDKSLHRMDRISLALF